MKDIKVLFMGTPEFSVNILNGLIENYNVVKVVSQPDKRIGRGKILTNTPVKEVALKNNISLFQPLNIKEEYKELMNLDIDLIVTCAYGQIIPSELINLPKYGAINVHASLLPKYRGGAPIQRSIMNGDKKTGISIMYMVDKMDAGDIISQEELVIENDDNLDTLSNKLSKLGTSLLLKTIPNIITNNINPIKQDESKVVYAKTIKREEEHLDFNDSSINIYNKIRSLANNPATYIILSDNIIKVYNSRIGESNKDGKIGEIINIYKDGIGIKCKDKEIILTVIKPSGKKKMLVKDYLNGIKKDDLLGKIVV